LKNYPIWLGYFFKNKFLPDLGRKSSKLEILHYLLNGHRGDNSHNKLF